MGFLVGLMVIGLGAVAYDVLLGPARQPAQGFKRRELLVELHLPAPVPEAAVVTVMLDDVPASVSRRVADLEKGEGDAYRLTWQGELKKPPQAVRGRLQAPGYVTEETGEVQASSDGEFLAVSLPPLVLKRPKGR